MITEIIQTFKIYTLNEWLLGGILGILFVITFTELRNPKPLRNLNKGGKKE